MITPLEFLDETRELIASLPEEIQHQLDQLIQSTSMRLKTSNLSEEFSDKDMSNKAVQQIIMSRAQKQNDDINDILEKGVKNLLIDQSLSPEHQQNIVDFVTTQSYIVSESKGMWSFQETMNEMTKGKGVSAMVDLMIHNHPELNDPEHRNSFEKTLQELIEKGSLNPVDRETKSTDETSQVHIR